MKKVGIITQHRVVNYGSVLQAYALQSKINELGYECEVIDYYPERFTPKGMLCRIKNKSEKFEKSIILRSVARMIVNVKPSAFLSDEFYGTLEKMQKTN